MIAAGVVRGRLALARAALWTRSRGRTRLREGAAAVAMTAAIAALLAWALALAFSGLRDAGLPEAQARVLVGWLFTATLAGVLAFDLHQALAALVAAPDLDLLRAAPLSPRALALLLLAEALPRSLPLVLALALPAVVGFAAAYGPPAAGVGGAVLALAGLWLAPLGLGLALALPVARVLPPARARDLLGLLSTFALVAAWLANALVVPRAGLAGASFAHGEGLLPALAKPPAWAPSAWAADALATAAAPGAALASLAAAALGGLALAAWSTRRHLAHALDRTHDAPRRTAGDGRARVARTWLGAFLARDARLFARQWSVAADVVAAPFLWMLLPLVATPVFPAGHFELARAMLVLLAAGVGYEAGARALALERAGLAWVRLAPAGGGRWILGRAAGVALLAAPLVGSAFVTLVLALRLPAGDIAALAEWTAAATAVALALGLLTGAAFADPAWNHPRAMLNAPGRLAGTLLLVVQAVAWLGLGLDRSHPPPGLLLAVAAVVVVAALRTAGHVLEQREVT